MNRLTNTTVKRLAVCIDSLSFACLTAVIAAILGYFGLLFAPLALALLILFTLFTTSAILSARG